MYVSLTFENFKTIIYSKNLIQNRNSELKQQHTVIGRENKLKFF